MANGDIIRKRDFEQARTNNATADLQNDLAYADGRRCGS
jgi:hypothetical protein